MKQQLAIPSLEADRLEAVRKSLASSIARWTAEGDQPVTAIPALSLHRREAPSEPTSCLYEPSICLIVQGAKRVFLGEDTYLYDPDHFLTTSVDLPATFQVIEASKEKPCLGLRYWNHVSSKPLPGLPISRWRCGSSMPSPCIA